MRRCASGDRVHQVIAYVTELNVFIPKRTDKGAANKGRRTINESLKVCLLQAPVVRPSSLIVRPAVWQTLLQ